MAHSSYLFGTAPDEPAEAETFEYHTNSATTCFSASDDRLRVLIAGKVSFRVFAVSSDSLSPQAEGRLAAGLGKAGYITDAKWGHQQYENSIAVSTSKGSIAIYHADRSIAQLRPQFHLAEHNRAVNKLDFSPHTGHALLSGSQDGTMKLWDLRAPSARAQLTFHGNADAVRDLRCSPHDPRRFAVVFDSGVIQKWDIRVPAFFEKRLSAHTGPGLCLAWHPQQELLLSGGRDRQILLWDMASPETRTPEITIPTWNPVSVVAWCRPTGGAAGHIAAAFFKDDFSVPIWSLGRRYIPDYLLEAGAAPVCGLHAPNSDLLWSVAQDGVFRQTRLSSEDVVLPYVNTQCLTWRGLGEISFAAQQREQFARSVALREPQSPAPLGTPATGPTAGLTAGSAAIPIPGGSGGSSYANSAATSPGASDRDGSSVDRRGAPSRTQSFWAAPKPALAFAASGLAALRHTPIVRQGSTTSEPEVTPQLLDVDLADFTSASMSRDVFAFLAEHYLPRQPDGIPLDAVCEFNASVAASAQRFRDCQVWRVLARAVAWEAEVAARRQAEAEAEAEAESAAARPSTAREMSEGGIGVETDSGMPSGMPSGPPSASGGAQSAEKLEHLEPIPNSVVSASLAPSGPSGPFVPLVPLLPSGPSVPSVPSVTPVPPVVQSVRSPEKRKPRTSSFLSDTYDDDELEYSGAGSRVAAIPIGAAGRGGRPSGRPSFLESITGVSADSGRQSAASSTVLSYEGSVRDTPTDFAADFLGQVSASAGAESVGLQRIDELPAEDSGHKNGNSGDSGSPNSANCDLSSEISENNSTNEPWHPRVLARKAVDYCAARGDCLTLGVLVLLLNGRYRLETSEQVLNEWIGMYVEVLTRYSLFTVAADVIRTCGLEKIKEFGTTEVEIRTLCPFCEQPLLPASNGPSDEPQVGVRICTNCRKRQSGCVLCQEPVKGMAVCILDCGHNGHFTCFKDWFIGNLETECPGGCGVVAVSWKQG